MKTVFVVDDNAVNLVLAKNVLNETYNTFTMPSAEKMLVLAEVVAPDLIILDIEMPSMNGFEALSILKSDEKFKSIPVIFLTGNHDVESQKRGYKMGASDFIQKPFSPPALIESIETHIQADRLAG